jgi:hypothetical protein
MAQFGDVPFMVACLDSTRDASMRLIHLCSIIAHCITSYYITSHSYFTIALLCIRRIFNHPVRATFLSLDFTLANYCDIVVAVRIACDFVVFEQRFVAIVHSNIGR